MIPAEDGVHLGFAVRLVRLAVLVPGQESVVTLGTILLIVLVLVLIGALPTWPHSSSWGYGPTGAVGVLVAIVIVLLVLRVI